MRGQRSRKLIGFRLWVVHKTYFLTDYDESKGTGTLKQYLNGELKDIDSDVKGFVRNNTSSFGSIFR